MEDNLQTVVLILGGAASISTLIMFFGWIYDRRDKARNIVTVPNIGAFLSLLGAGFAWAGEVDLSLFCYTALWIFLSANFFMTPIAEEGRYKVVVFNLIFVTALLFSMFSARSIKYLNDTNSRLIETMEKIVEVIDVEHPVAEEQSE